MQGFWEPLGELMAEGRWQGRGFWKHVDGFIALGPIPGCRGAASCRPPRSWHLGRRSGRVPALPYPLPRLVQCIADHGHQAIHGRVASVQDGAEEIARNCAPRPGSGTRALTPRRMIGAVRGSISFILKLLHDVILIKRRIVRNWIAVI